MTKYEKLELAACLMSIAGTACVVFGLSLAAGIWLFH